MRMEISESTVEPRQKKSKRRAIKRKRPSAVTIGGRYSGRPTTKYTVISAESQKCLSRVGGLAGGGYRKMRGLNSQPSPYALPTCVEPNGPAFRKTVPCLAA